MHVAELITLPEKEGGEAAYDVKLSPAPRRR